MITEQELELALSLRDKIKELKILIGKLESVVLSSSQVLSSGISVDNNKIILDEHTRNILIKFKDDIINTNKWYYDNIDKVKKYQKENMYKLLANCAKYRATKLNATPKWLTKTQLEEIKQIYKNCPKGYHVDHIVPLQGKNARGLHVPWNLQILIAKENLSKSNKLIKGSHVG